MGFSARQRYASIQPIPRQEFRRLHCLQGARCLPEIRQGLPESAVADDIKAALGARQRHVQQVRLRCRPSCCSAMIGIGAEHHEVLATDRGVAPEASGCAGGQASFSNWTNVKGSPCALCAQLWLASLNSPGSFFGIVGFLAVARSIHCREPPKMDEAPFKADFTHCLPVRWIT